MTKKLTEKEIETIIRMEREGYNYVQIARLLGLKRATIASYMYRHFPERKHFKNKGFGSMEKDKRMALSVLGGINAQKTGTAHRWTSEEAKIASVKGKIAYLKIKHSKKHHEEQEIGE